MSFVFDRRWWLIDDASSEAVWVTAGDSSLKSGRSALNCRLLGLGLRLLFEEEKGTFPMNPPAPAPPPRGCCGQLGSFRFAKTADAIAVRFSKLRPRVGFQLSSG